MGIKEIWTILSRVGLERVQNQETRHHMMTINQTLVVIILATLGYNSGYMLYDSELLAGPVLINCIAALLYATCFLWTSRGHYRSASLHFALVGQCHLVALTSQLSSSSGVNLWMITIGTTAFLFVPRKDRLLSFLLPLSSGVLFIWSHIYFSDSEVLRTVPESVMNALYGVNVAGSIFVGVLVAYFFQTTLLKTQQDLMTANSEKQQANETKDKFFSIISHDLRGPAGSIAVLFNEVLERGSDISDELFESLQGSTKNTHQLLENLLTWARSQKGEIEFEPVSFLVASSVEGNLGLFSGPALQKEIRLVGETEPGLCAYADLEMVTTIIRNLINNAIKFTPPKGQIKVSAKVQNDQVLIEVQDSGVGISQNNLDSLFQLDQKTQSSLGTNSEEGSGLGLILCSEFVSRNGGEIGVESKLGEGSNFWFTLPQGKADIQREDSRDQKAFQPASSMRVILADDNSLHRESSSVALNELGLEFQVVSNGTEAVQQFQSGAFNVVLMDIDMPETNGIEATLKIREQFGDDPLIIALSSYTKLELDGLAPEAYFNAHLNKPLDKTKLLHLLQSHQSETLALTSL